MSGMQLYCLATLIRLALLSLLTFPSCGIYCRLDADTAIINNALNVIRRRRMEKWTGTIHSHSESDSLRASSNIPSSKTHRRHINMLDMMMGVGEHRTSVYPASMSDRQLLDECVTSMLAHQETCCNALAWAMVMLARLPEWQERAREEADCWSQRSEH